MYKQGGNLLSYWADSKKISKATLFLSDIIMLFRSQQMQRQAKINVMYKFVRSGSLDK